MKIAIVGGGAAGFFAAITCAETEPRNEVVIFEKSSKPLQKVRISGGGRCNVTHACFDPREFVMRYPRGARELIGALTKFGASDTVAWFEKRGARLKTEADGRVFPVTDSSGTIVNCLLFEARQASVRLLTRTGVESIERNDAGFVLTLTNGERASFKRVLLATGGARDEIGARIATSLGHHVEPPVPSLFTFESAETPLRELAGVSVADAELFVCGTRLRERGPLLITHRGLSGPVVLRVSAWGARELHAVGYKFTAQINWLPLLTDATIATAFAEQRAKRTAKLVINSPLGGLSARLWEHFCATSGVAASTTWSHFTRTSAQKLASEILRSRVDVDGKSLNKDEFVTCGGVLLSEVNFKTMESRVTRGLFFAGELLDVDGITGGFNFQAAWTTGFLAGHAMAQP